VTYAFNNMSAGAFLRVFLFSVVITPDYVLVRVRPFFRRVPPLECRDDRSVIRFSCFS